jgi:hypothetical protein
VKTAISGEGTRIAYDEPGEGPPLILVGGAFNTRSFGPNGGLDYQKGKPLPAERWASVTMPTLVAVGGKNPDWMRHAMRGELADVLPTRSTASWKARRTS